MTRKRIGILGCGAIGGALVRSVLETPSLALAFVYSRNEKRFAEFPPGIATTVDAAVLMHPTDLVIEAAHADLVKAMALRIVEKSDLMIFSVTALADDEFREKLEHTAMHHRHNVFIPHGAIIGMDGLIDGGSTVKSVTITTTKSPASLGLPSQEHKVVYEGSTRGACARFPRNVNVHATIALCGIGFDRTVSRIVADPTVSTNSHLLEIGGDGYKFKIEVSSEAGGKVSGAYMLHSAIGALNRVTNRHGGLQFV
jgi:aspartate dehydrogenase